MARAISEDLVMRHVATEGVLSDERVTIPLLGRGTSEAGARLLVVFSGTVHLVGASPRTLLPGDYVVAPTAGFFTRSDAASTLELDLRTATAVRATVTGKLPAAARDRLRAVAAALWERSDVDALARDVEAWLVAEGVLGGRPLSLACAPEDQRTIALVDRSLERLASQPMRVDLEDGARASAKTVSRRIDRVHARFGLHGLGARTDWRATRDFYRILVAALLASSGRLPTRELAAYSGYGSAEALCHAFAARGLPSPARFRAAVEAA
jgi:AraC-like DNA-binding protein